MMITMSYQSSGGGPPLPKRTTSQRQPHVTTDRFNHTRAPPVRSNSADTPPPLPPHHPESKTLPRSKKNESDVPPRNHNAPESPSRTRRRNSEDSHPIQRRTFETKSFVDRHTAKIFSDPEKINKSMKFRHSYDHTSRALPALPPNHAEPSSKQTIRERPLPPPPSTDIIPSTDRRPFVSEHASHHERPLPPPPDLSSIPTFARRQSIPEGSSPHDQPPPPPPPTKSIPISKSILAKSHHIPAVFEASSHPPPPVSRQPNTYHVKLELTSGDKPPPLPPSRPRGHSTSSQGSQQTTTNAHDFESRFFFHEETEFPSPEQYSNEKKVYPSKAVDKKKRDISAIGAL